MKSNEPHNGDRREFFVKLREHWMAGRRIVPLFGNGISVDVGLPTGSQLGEYLERVHYVTDPNGHPDSHSRTAEYLATHGWPSRHQLQLDLLVRHCAQPDRDSHSLKLEIAQLAAGALATFPSASNQGWINLLKYLTGPDPDSSQRLMDACFSRLVRGRKPGTAHQLVAFLTKVLNWNPILTTNFDDLVESALRAEGLSPTVYELTTEGKLPDPRLVHGGLSVIKLHGGAYGIRAGFDLSQSADSLTTDYFAKYLTDDAVLLVLGYGGGDSRLLRLIEDWLATADCRGEVLWVYRTQPPNLERRLDDDEFEFQRLRAKITLHKSADAGRFLHELHQRVMYSHPAGLNHYTALHHAPGATYDQLSTRQLLPVPEAAQHRWDLRAKLLNAVPKNCQPLWFNLHELTSFPAFVALLLESLAQYDRGLPPMVRPPEFDLRPERQPSADAHAWLRRCRNYVRHALWRHNYVLVIDANRAFRRFVPDEECKRQRRLLYDFLVQIASEAPFPGDDNRVLFASPRLADSRIALALDPNDVEAYPLDHAALKAHGLDVVNPVSGAPPARASLTPAECERLERYVNELKRKSPTALRLLKIAITFGRARSVVGLVRVTARYPSGESIPPSSTTSTDRVLSDHHADYQKIEEAIDMLVEDGVLAPHDGGFYSVTSHLRGAFSGMPAVNGNELDRASRHNLVADYYRCELYEHSRDLAAYFEYLYHRAEYAELEAPDKDGRRWGMEWLIASLGRETSYLISHGRTHALLDAFSRLARTLDKQIKTERVSGEIIHLEQLRDTFLKVRAELHRDVMAYEECIRYHRERLRELLGAEPDAPALDTFTNQEADAAQTVARMLQAAEHMLSLGSCTGAQSKVTDAGEREARNWIECAQRLGERLNANSRRLGLPEIRDAAGLIILRCFEWSSRHALETLDPWDGGREQPIALADEIGDKVRFAYREAKTLVRSLSHGPKVRQLQSSLRCNRARALYLCRHFADANIELNRAHAFAARGLEPDGHPILARYHLHRAEYCILRARRSIQARDARWLLQSAKLALNDAKKYLSMGRKDVSSWRWLFLLQAWRSCDHVKHDSGPLSDSIESNYLPGLHAIAAGVFNEVPGDRWDARFASAWDDLRTSWYAAHRSAGDAGLGDQPVEDGWELLNHRAGLGWYWSERMQRYEAHAVWAEVAGVICTVADLNELGLRLLHDVALSTTGNDRLIMRLLHNDAEDGRDVEVRPVRADAFEFVRVPLSARLALRSWITQPSSHAKPRDRSWRTGREPTSPSSFEGPL